MTAAIEHPDWVAIGRKVEVVRRIGRSVSHRHTATITRHTATSVFADGYRFQAKRGGYHAVPRYLDYVTELRPIEVES